MLGGVIGTIKEEEFLRCAAEQLATSAVRLLEAKAAPPQDIVFLASDHVRAGDPVCVNGPHGPLLLPMPEVAPGTQVTVRMGPPAAFRITVPAGADSETLLRFKGPQGELFHASVPRGKRPGDTVDLVPASLMVQVPPDAYQGDWLVFPSSDGRRVAQLQHGLEPGQYFVAAL